MDALRSTILTPMHTRHFYTHTPTFLFTFFKTHVNSFTKYKCTHLTSLDKHWDTTTLEFAFFTSPAPFHLTHFTLHVSHTTLLHPTLTGIITSIYTRCMLVKKPTWGFSFLPFYWHQINAFLQPSRPLRNLWLQLNYAGKL